MWTTSGQIRSTAAWILRNLPICATGHMTPEIRLRLLTPECPLWTAQPDQCPYKDPYWAFYWPGGQALTRFVLDHPDLVRGRRVLDFGTGCGATAIASLIGGARSVVANDIDRVALLATAMNAKLNRLDLHDRLIFESDDLIRTSSKAVVRERSWDVITVGDMCYDSEFASALLRWLSSQRSTMGARVIVGDPGRHGLKSAGDVVKLRTLARYTLPEHMTREHYGLSVADIYEME